MIKYRIVGYLNGAYLNSEGDLIEINKQYVTRFYFIMKLLVFYCKIFYDYVEVSYEETI